jgi:ubiquitin C-terminal hydrolase
MLICIVDVSEREEYFQDVTVIVKGFKSLTDSLRAFVDYELLNGENQYSCDNCKQKSDAKKRVVFRALPPILIFALSRFEYDYQHVTLFFVYFIEVKWS